MFRVDDLFREVSRDPSTPRVEDDRINSNLRSFSITANQATDIKNSVLLDIFGELVLDEYQEIKVWDFAKYGKVIDSFSKNYVDYVIVMFDHPGNPPSNSIQYIYRAP